MKNLARFAIALTLVLSGASAFAAGKKTTPIVNQYVAELEKLQDEVEFATGAASAMSNDSMALVVKAVDDAMAFFRKVSLEPITDQFTEEDQRRFFDEMLAGNRDDDTRGSLTRLFWASMTHIGFDANMLYDENGEAPAYKKFFYAFTTVFRDLRSAFTIRRDKGGKTVWAPRERGHREMVARNLIVRFYDMHEAAVNEEGFLKSDTNLRYIEEQMVNTVQEGSVLRNVRAAAEYLAIMFYASGLLSNLQAPSPFPLVYWDWAGQLSGGIWGSSMISGASFFAAYLTALSYKLFTRTSKTHDMMTEFLRLSDPFTTAELKALADRDMEALTVNDKAKLDKAVEEMMALRKRVREGRGAIAAHRRKMIERGYDPKNPGKFVDCEGALLFEKVSPQLFR